MSTKDPSPPAQSEEPGFEQILSQLDGIVRRLEGGDEPLEHSLELFERGVRLSRKASGVLDAAERRVEILLQEGERAELDLELDEEEDE